MEKVTPLVAGIDEREEGEIVEDELEDVSDCSMSPGSPLYSGKSVSPPELLSAVCLSSVSSSEFSATGEGRLGPRKVSLPCYRKETRRQTHKRKRRLEQHTHQKPKRRCPARHRRRKSVVVTILDSDTDSASEVVDPTIAKQLRAALRRESSHDALHNSLKSRLKAFIDPDSHSEDDRNLDALRDLALLSTLKAAENTKEFVSDIQSEKLEIVDSNKNESQKEAGDLEREGVGQSGSDSERVQSSEGTNHNEDKQNECDKKSEKGGGIKVKERLFESMDDSELQELRIAALRSFVIENHKRRRRKIMAQNQEENLNQNNLSSNINNKEDTRDIDKENDQRMMNNDLDAKSNKFNSNNNIENNLENGGAPTKVNDRNGEDSNCKSHDTTEEDADILRAMLLASMSKRLATNSAEDDSSSKKMEFPLYKVEKSNTSQKPLNVTVPKPVFRTLKGDMYNLTNTSSANHFKSNKVIEAPHIVVKPLIINVNADSDSDMENYVSNVSDSNITFKATVTEFLKKQRAEVEATMKTKSPANASHNKSDDLLMKSAMKLLPRSQQLEYRRLKQQLLNARKKMRIRRTSLQRLSESKRENTVNAKKVPKPKTDAIINNAGAVTVKAARIQEKKTLEPADHLQKTLNDLQIRRNGRLQMKGKYRSLAPLLHRINQASNERRLHEVEIKKLLQQIQKARTKLAISHQNCTGLVQQLLYEKGAIDQRVFKAAKLPQTNLFTSTPNKLVKTVRICDISNVKENNVKEISETCINSTNVIDNTQLIGPDDVNIVRVETPESDCDAKKTEDTRKAQEEEVLLDPNDITKVFVEQPSVEMVTIPKYTSPLDNRDSTTDPLTTICPYDLLGVCKDKECRYVHCS